jgi:hypothetical protein
MCSKGKPWGQDTPLGLAGGDAWPSILALQRKCPTDYPTETACNALQRLGTRTELKYQLFEASVHSVQRVTTLAADFESEGRRFDPCQAHQ